MSNKEMTKEEKKKKSFLVFDFLILLTILLQGANQLIVLPTPAFKYPIAALFLVLLVKYIKDKRKIHVNPKIAFALAAAYAFSFIVSPSSKLFVPMVFLLIEILAFKMYIGLFETKKEFFEHFLKLILAAAIIITAVGFVQIVGYKLGIRPLYDYKWLGIIPNHYIYLDEGRFYSIYDEPAHLCTILGSALFASFYFYKQKKQLKYLGILLFILVFVLFTGSVVTYAAALIFALFIIFYNYHYLNKKTPLRLAAVLLVPVLIFAVFSFIKPSLVENASSKITNFFSNNTGSVYQQNVTTFALKSNYLIAKEKIDDGYYLGTGIFTHEQYYYKYIDRVYQNRWQRNVNYTDAASIFIRMISEFGFLSLLMFVYIVILLIRAFVKKDYVATFFLLLFITQGMRLGDYAWFFNCFSIVAFFSMYGKHSLFSGGNISQVPSSQACTSADKDRK